MPQNLNQVKKTTDAKLEKLKEKDKMIQEKLEEKQLDFEKPNNTAV